MKALVTTGYPFMVSTVRWRVRVLDRALAPRWSGGHGMEQRAVTWGKAYAQGRASCVLGTPDPSTSPISLHFIDVEAGAQRGHLHVVSLLVNSSDRI